MRTTILLLAIVGTLCACKANDPPPPAKERAQTEAEKTVFDTQIKSLQKAKDVQKIVDQQKDATDKQVQDEGH